MSNKTKKRVFTLALVVALLAILMAGGTLAWFTAEDSATNTFTVGSVEITQHEKEYERDENGDRTDDLKDFDDSDGKKQLLPVVNTENPFQDPSYQDKIVTVENTGKNAAYVRTHIAIPSNLVSYLKLDTIEEEGNWVYENLYTTTVGEMDYTVFFYRYDQKLEKDAETPVLLKGVYLDASVDVQLNENSGEREFCKRNQDGTFTFSGFAVEDATEIHVLVLTQAVQADGFVDALDALDNAFGAGNADFSNVKP